jgi:tetratricopeptide (TPR) repeat protein
MLELDAENAALQSRLADLYLKMGKHGEARNIYLNAAQSLHSRGALDGADNALARVLALDPDYTPALLLRGQIACEAGNAVAAIDFLERLPNIDSQPEALRALLRSHLQLGNTADAIPLATKLLVVHNELGGIIALANALMAAGEFEGALRLYSQHGERLLAANTAGLLEGLYACIERIKDNPAALELLRDLFQKAGEIAHLNEVTELLAHACVQSGDLLKARDYYQQLAELEPQNPIHAQNYRQMVARLGEDSATRPLTEEQRGQAFMVDELEIAAPAIEQEYPEEIATSVRAALTDSELLDSYNLPAKAIAPLETALQSAPRDAMLNQRLASLYARVERFSEAAGCCDLLHDVYVKAGHTELADQYADMAAKYRQRIVETAPQRTPHLDVTPDAVPVEVDLSPPEAKPAPTAAPHSAAAQPWDALPHRAPAQEADHSEEWEGLVSVEPMEAPSQLAEPQAMAAPENTLAERLEEIKFYLAQSMLDEAEAAIAKCSGLSPAVPELAGLQQQLASARDAQPATPEVEVEIEEVPSETSPPQPSISTLVFDETALGLAPPKPAPDEDVSHAVEEPVAAAEPRIVHAPPATAPRPPVQPAAAAAADVLSSFALELDRSLGSDFNLAAPAPPPAAQPAAVAHRHREAMVAVAEPVAAPVVFTAVPTAAPEPPAPSPAASPLADIFEAFKQGLEEDRIEEADDPETHYNLGIAFREMGLLDEAIGELQKVCQAIERGFPFPHAVHAYTWLAHCLCHNGAPQAAVKWYEKALKLSNLDDESRLGVYYEMASAHEAAGNKQVALANFMEVYATNIDYRDVAERIKSLKS